MAQRQNLALFLCRPRQCELAKQVTAKFAAGKSLYRRDRSNFRGHEIYEPIHGARIVARRFALHHTTNQRDDIRLPSLNVIEDSIHGDMIAGLRELSLCLPDTL